MKFFTSFFQIALAVLLLFFMGPVALVSILFIADGSESFTVLSKYPRLLKRLPPPVAAHFPKSIPTDPNRVRVIYHNMGKGFGGFTQAELWMRLQPGEADRLFAEFKKQSAQAKSLGQIDNVKNFAMGNPNDKAAWPPTWPRTNEDMRDHALPEDFTILWLDVSESVSWLRGVAISRKRDEIIYFVQYPRMIYIG